MSRVRIVGGEWRSRLLDVTSVPGLRPTPDRVRETLFNWLGQDLDGQACLDLFAGTGILGFEAASRGAASVLMVERDARALDALHKAAKTLQAAQVEIVRGDAVRFVQTTPQTFDGVFLDPPYATSGDLYAAGDGTVAADRPRKPTDQRSGQKILPS